MGLRFILGRAGYGKTTLCCDEICRRLEEGGDNPLILLVPEQATFQNEIALASRVPAGGLLRAQVLSFRRLAWRVLNEVGGANGVYISDLGRRMIIRSIIDRLKGELTVFARAACQNGFTDVMASLLSELKMYRVMPGDLSRAAGDAGSGSRDRLSGKISDIDMIYTGFENHLRGRFLDPDDYMNLLAGRIHLSPSVAGAEVWVDGFTGFTPQEYAVLEKMMEVAARVSVAVCAPGDVLEKPPSEGDVFFATGETVQRARRLAAKNGVPVESPVILDRSRRFVRASALDYLEKHFFDHRPDPYQGGAPEIKLVAASGTGAEVEAAAREIIRLCRDEGYRWRDIAVLVRDINMYHVPVSTVFRDYGIPFFIDHKGSVTHHPLVEIIRSALEAAGRGWPYEAVFRYLKTDLAPVSREDVDILENYVLAHGIGGGAWLDPKDWEYKRVSREEEEDSQESRALLDRVNRTRREGLRALAEFYRRVGPDRASTVRSLSEAIFTLLVDLDAPTRLVEWSESALKEGDLARAAEHDRIWGQVVDLLDQVVAAFGDDPATPEKFAGILESGLVSLRMGLVPPGLDQVTVGSLDRSRSPEVRAALVLGVNDGIFPARHTASGLLTDSEREVLAGRGIRIDPGSRINVFNEQFLVYTALTRAADRLWISWTGTDGEGRPMIPSRIVGTIREVIPAARVYTVEADPPGPGEEDLEYIAGKGRTMGYLASRLREYLSGKGFNSLWIDVYNWYAGDTSSVSSFEKVRAGLFYRNADRGLSPAAAGDLYGGRLRAGVSGIEKFNSCAFAHFLTYGIRVRERLNYRVTPPDMGLFFHLALKMFADRIRRDSLDWGLLDKDLVSELAGEVADSIAQGLLNEIFLSSSRYRYLVYRLKRRLIRSAAVLAEQARRGRFRPVALEVGFGPGAALPPLMVDLPGGGKLEITGRIDRVDACRWEKGNHIVVIDYKSGFNDIDLTAVYFGVGIQLPAYLDVAVTNAVRLTGSEGKPGGIFYFTVADPVIRAAGPLDSQEAEKRIRKQMRMRGLVLADRGLVKLLDSEMDGYSEVIPVSLTSGGDFYKNSPVVSEDQFTLMRQHLHRLYRKAGGEILSGRVDIRPVKIGAHTACRFCGFGPVCQFDPALPENRYRIAPSLEAAEIWRRMASAGGGGEDE